MKLAEIIVLEVTDVFLLVVGLFFRLCCRFRRRPGSHFQPRRGQDQSDGQRLPEVLQRAAAARS